MELVSVIVAVYNVEHYIEKCLLSIKNQTYTNIEVIVVDDGSNDGSSIICEKIASTDTRFKVIHKVNAGLGYARNTGLEYATGDHVVFIDGDDFIEPEMIETFVKYNCETGSDMIICGFKRYYDENKTENITKTNTPIIFEGESQIIKEVLCPIIGNDAHKLSKDGREMCVWTNFYAMEIIKKYDLKFVSEREYLSEDFFFNIPYIKHTKRILMIPDCLYNYRFNPSSLSNAYRPNKFEILNNFMERARVLLDKEEISKYSSKRLQCLYFMKLRKALLQISAADIPRKEKREKVYRAVTSQQCIEALNDYPIKDVKLNESIMLILLKNKKVSTLNGYMEIQRYMLNMRNLIRKKRK